MGHMSKLHLGILTALRGAGGGGDKGARTPIESPDSLRSIAYARIVDLVSEGEIVGFADQENPLSCVFLNETPVANSDGTLNFRNIQIDSRVGTQTQDYLPNFEGVENEIAVGVELRDDSPWVRSITNLNLNSVRVRLSTPTLTKTNTSNGDITGHSVSYRIELQTDGGSFVTKLTSAFTGKTTSKYERSHLIELPPATTGWTLRVTRITANATTSAIQDLTFVESYAEIVEAKLRMPMSALVSCIVDAEQFNSIPSRAYRLKGRIVRVPSNYDPDTREYTGVWDGTFQSRYSNNPAWVFYDMALNQRYGLGHLVPQELVDKWTLYRIAQYCDQLVPDGFGNLEPRFTCNLVLQSQNDALRVMQDLATVFRGIIYANGGSITAVGDMPEDPVYTYTPANVIDGKFVYSGSSRKVRHTVALVSWSDLADFGRAKVEYVEDPEGIARYGIQQTEVIAIGCTSQGQARRWGRYLLATERYETDTVAFGVGLDGTVVAPGKIINIADPLRAGERRGGRIKSATVNSVTVDFMSIAMQPGDVLVATLPTGVTQRRTIDNIAGNVITVTENFTLVPVAQSVWAIDSVGVPLASYRVLGVADRDEGDSLGYSITAIVHIPGKFGYADTGEPIETPPIPQVPGPVVPSPTGLTITQRDVTDQNTTTKIVNLSWDKVTVAVAYNVQWRQGEGPWTDLGTAGFTNVDIPNVNPGPFEVQVVAINSVGQRSLPTFGGPYDITPVGTPPGFVEDITTGMEVLEQIGLENQADIAQEIIDRLQGDADTAAQAATDLAGEASARAAADLQVAQDAADALLNAQTTLEAAITTEATTRQSADESLASQIATISAGTGEQFDVSTIWYFDTATEGWTSTGTTTVTDGWLRPANHATAPYARSPALDDDGSLYRYAKMRVRRTGVPTWLGKLRWITASDTTWDDAKSVTIPEPTFDPNGIATVDFKDISWPANITGITLYLFTAQTATDYVEFDWIAVGRPSPGASAAALQEERTARIAGDAAEATQRTTLASQMRGNYTGSDINALTSGLLYSERQARTTADSAMASDITALDARLDDAESDIGLQASAVADLTTRVTAVEGVNTSQASSITSLTSRMTAAEGVNTSQATALTNLTTRVTNAEGEIDSLSTDLTSLTATVAGKADSSALSALTARVTAAEGVNTSQANSITSLQANAGTAANLIPNSDFETNDTTYWWNASPGGSTATFNLRAESDQWSLPVDSTSRVAQIYQPDNSQTPSYHEARTGVKMTVEPGKTYQASAYAGAHRADSRIFWYWYDADDNNIGNTYGGPSTKDIASNEKAGGQLLSGYKRIWQNGVAPANAAKAVVALRKIATVPASSDSYLFFTRVQFTEVPADNNSPLPWSPSATGTGINASAIQSLDTRVTTAEGNITANASAITSLTTTVNGKASASAVTALEARVTSVEGVNTSQASSITQLKSTMGGGGNLMPNSDFALGMSDWAVSKSGGTGGTATLYPGTDNLSYYIPERGGVFIRNVGGNAIPAGSYMDLDDNGHAIPVTAGKRYIASVYLGVHRGDGQIYFRWLDANKAHISYTNPTMAVTDNGGTALSQFGRAKVVGTAPANAAFCRVKIRIVGNAETGTDSYLFVNSPMVEEAATADQTEPSPYSVGMTGTATITQLAMTTASSALGKANATIGVTVDVNGYVTGYKLTNDGSTGIFSIVADKFQIVSPGGGARTEFSNGNWRVYDASGVMRVRMGIW